MFSEREKANIRNYKYHGGDKSPIYQHILSPLAQYFVDNWTPLTVAPNVITATGLLAVVFTTALGLAMDPSMTSECPSWFCYLLAGSIFFYQTLDNMDGKQARKTGSSSALGMLFDHSCDAINSVVMSLACAKVMGIGWTNKIFLFYMYAYCPFFFQTWLEYFSGSMWLPPFNGPSEGLLMVMGVCILSGYHGSQWWHQKSDVLTSLLHLTTGQTYDVERFDCVVVLGIIIQLGTFSGQILEVIKIARKKRMSMSHPLFSMSPFVALTLSSVVWIRKSNIAMQAYPFMTYGLIGSCFVELMVNFLVVHITKSEFQANQRILIWTFLALPINSYLDDVVDESMLLMILSTAAFTYTFNYVVTVLQEFAEIIDINIFKLGPRDE